MAQVFVLKEIFVRKVLQFFGARSNVWLLLLGERLFFLFYTKTLFCKKKPDESPALKYISV